MKSEDAYIVYPDPSYMNPHTVGELKDLTLHRAIVVNYPDYEQCPQVRSESSLL